MPKKIFVGSLSATTTPATVNATFAPFGRIVASKVLSDANGATIGAEIEYATDEAGTDAIAAKNNSVLDGSRITVGVGR